LRYLSSSCHLFHVDDNRSLRSEPRENIASESDGLLGSDLFSLV